VTSRPEPQPFLRLRLSSGKDSLARRRIVRLQASWFRSTERTMLTEIWKAGKQRHPLSIPCHFGNMRAAPPG
jgi:hypothetical protein